MVGSKVWDVWGVISWEHWWELWVQQFCFGLRITMSISILFQGAIPEFSHFLFLMKVKSFLLPGSWLTMSFTYSLYDDLHSFWVYFCSWRYRSQFFFIPVLRYLLNALCFRLDSRRIFRLHQGWLCLAVVCLNGTRFLRLARQMALKSDHRLFIGVFILEQSINLSKETFRLFVMFVIFTFFHR